MKLSEIMEKVASLANQYKEKHTDLNDEQLYPRDWYFIDDEELCAKILEEALEKDILIRDSELYIKEHMQMVNDKLERNIKISVDNLMGKYK